MTTSDFVPDWAKGIVWYQIFPERFWNGDPGNDPRLEDQAGRWKYLRFGAASCWPRRG
jgi:hypothetical protein